MKHQDSKCLCHVPKLTQLSSGNHGTRILVFRFLTQNLGAPTWSVLTPYFTDSAPHFLLVTYSIHTLKFFPNSRYYAESPCYSSGTDTDNTSHSWPSEFQWEGFYLRGLGTMILLFVPNNWLASESLGMRVKTQMLCPSPRVWFSKSRTGPRNVHVYHVIRWSWSLGPRNMLWEPPAMLNFMYQLDSAMVGYLYSDLISGQILFWMLLLGCCGMILTFQLLDGIKQIALPDMVGPHLISWRCKWNKPADLPWVRENAFLLTAFQLRLWLFPTL